MTNQKSKRTIQKRIKIRYLSNSSFPWLLFCVQMQSLIIIPYRLTKMLGMSGKNRLLLMAMHYVSDSVLFHHDK